LIGQPWLKGGVGYAKCYQPDGHCSAMYSSKYPARNSIAREELLTHVAWTCFAFQIFVEMITDEMLADAVSISFKDISPQDFVHGHRRGFIKAIRNVVGGKHKDIIIISVQVGHIYSVWNTSIHCCAVLLLVKKIAFDSYQFYDCFA